MTEGVVGQTEEDSSNLDDFYDPEDIEGANDIEVSDLDDGAFEEEPFEPLLNYGLQRDELDEFRMGGCTRKSFLKKLPLFTTRSAPLTRTIGIFVGSLLGTGSGNCNFKSARNDVTHFVFLVIIKRGGQACVMNRHLGYSQTSTDDI